MARVIQPVGTRGSLKWIQRAVNLKPLTLDRPIAELTGISLPITWLSPLASDDYAEYRDDDFLRRIGAAPYLARKLESYWPRRGPQWDALGKSASGDVFLVEAKAHVKEIFSSGTQATEGSRAMIERALSETAEFLGAKPRAAWSDTFYQLANRLAHLCFLRREDISAWLVLVNFMGDKEMGGPASAAEWEAAYKVVNYIMGLDDRHALSCYVIHIYPQVAALAPGVDKAAAFA
jgi:hypothetical protein